MFVDLGIRYGQRKEGLGIPAGAEHGLKARKRRTAEQWRCIKHGTLYPFHPSLKAFDAGLSTDDASLNAVGLGFVKWPEECQAIARVLHRLVVPEQETRLRNVDEFLHSAPPSGSSSKASPP